MRVRDTRMSFALALAAALLLSLSFGAAAGEGEADEPSLYERLGGLAPITVVVSDFLDALIPDPQLNENPAIDAARERVPAPYLKYQVTAFVCQATGGPCEYHGRDMESSHAHLDITEAEWDRMVVIFKEVLDEHGVPEQEQHDLLELLGTTKEGVVSA